MKQILNFWGRHGDPGDPSNALPEDLNEEQRPISCLQIIHVSMKIKKIV